MANLTPIWPHRRRPGPAHWLSLFLALTACTTLALFLRHPQPYTAWNGARDLIVVLDVSASMLVTEPGQKHNRLEEAKEKTGHLTATINPARTGLILMAGSAFWAMPLTESRQSFDAYLQAASPLSLSDSGSQLRPVIRLLKNSYCPAGGKKCFVPRPTTVLIVSDGEFFDRRLAAALLPLSKGGMDFVFLAMGEQPGQVPSFDILGHQGGGRISLDGSPLLSSPRPDILHRLSRQVNGKVIPAAQIGQSRQILQLDNPPRDYSFWLLFTAWLASLLWLVTRNFD